MKILVLCLPGIGDALMATPMIRMLKQGFPKSQIDVAYMLNGTKTVFENNPYIENIYHLSLYKGSKIDALRKIRNLRKNKYDVSLLAFPAYRREYHLIHRIIGAKRRVAHKFKSGYWKEFNFINTNLVPVNESEHNVENNLNLLSSLGIEYKNTENLYYDLTLNQEDELFGKNFLKDIGWEDDRVIAIHPGSTNSPAALLRRWPIERFAETGKYLIKNGYKILIFSGPEEKDLGESLEKMIDHPNSCLSIKGVKLGQSLGILKNTHLLLCNDNGFGHLANALKVPIVSLWASTNDLWSGPYDKKIVNIIRPENMKPWYRYDLKRKIPKRVGGGIKRISTGKVIDTLNKVLKIKNHHS